MADPRMLNVGSYIAPRNAGALATITAAAGNDNVEQNGPSIDRLGYDSAVIAILSRATLTGGQTLALSVTLQDSSDGSTFADVAAEHQPGGIAGGGVLATLSTAGDNHYLSEYSVNLRGLRQYVRVQFTGNLSAGATDTATIACVMILGGAQTMPV